MTSRNLMIITVVLLLGIFTMLALQYSRKAPNDSIGGSINEVAEEIGDEIDDHTDSR